MKIGFDTDFISYGGPLYGRRNKNIAELLAGHYPTHDYCTGSGSYVGVDVYHAHLYSLAWPRRGVRTVVTVSDMGFLRSPEGYSFLDRVLRIRYYKYRCRHADRVIALSSKSGDELSEKLGIDRDRVEVVMPLAGLGAMPKRGETVDDVVRRKYSLPAGYILLLGAVEPRHHHETLLKAVSDGCCDVVICGRHTAYSDYLLDYARRHHIAMKVNFIYELSPDDLPSLFSMASCFVYLPSVDAPILPLVEAMRVDVPMVLSDTSINREAAAEAALYVDPLSSEQVRMALGNIFYNNEIREKLLGNARRQAELFSEHAVARRLIDIYTSL